MTSLETLLNNLWIDYLELNPDARRIRELLESRGESIVNDHIAFRTFDDDRIHIDVLAKVFLEGGYTEKDSYEFPAKKLDARHYEHPDPAFPRIFLSELRTGDFSDSLQKTITGLLDQIPGDFAEREDFLYAGRPWEISYQSYEELRAESEYAGWMAALGFRPNHFTVSVNELRTFKDIRELVDFLKGEGFCHE